MPRLNICHTCWAKFTPKPSNFTVRFNGMRDTCDFCGQENTDGIYIREDRPEAPEADATRRRPPAVR